MSALPIPWPHAGAPATGAAAGVPISVPAIREGDTLLSVVSHVPGDIAAHDVSDFVVSAGAIASSSVDTDGRYMLVLFAETAEP